MALKNNVDVFYFAVLASGHVFFTEDGMMDKKVFLATWKDIPPTNEFQQQINNISVPVGKEIVHLGQQCGFRYMN